MLRSTQHHAPTNDYDCDDDDDDDDDDDSELYQRIITKNYKHT